MFIYLQREADSPYLNANLEEFVSRTVGVAYYRF